jgi:hypothetical protein
MPGEEDPRGRGKADSGAGRPRWWALLAVSLALMALVASLTTGSPPTPRAGAGAAAHRSSGGGGTPVRRPDGTGTGSRRPQDGAITEAGATGAPGARPSPGTGGSVSGGPGPSTTPPPSRGSTEPVTVTPTSTAPFTTTTSGATSTAGTATVTTTTTSPTASTRSEVGNLTYPDNVTALYSFPGAGPLEATATWAGGAVLTLSVVCPGRRTTRTGGSGLSVSVSQGTQGDGGTCTVSISEATTLRAEVSYSIDVRGGQEVGA